MAQAPDVFSVTTLTTSNVVAVDAAALAGDDDGFLGVTGTKFLFGGDLRTIAYDLADLGNPYTTNIDNSTQQNNWLFSDLKTQTSYLFDATGSFGLHDISGIQPLDQTGDISGAIIPLSTVISIDNSVDSCTIFASGYGRAAIWDGCLGVIYDIELPSGVVTTIAGAATFATYDSTIPLLQVYETNNYVSQGVVVEYDGTNLRFVAVAANSGNNSLGIYRYDAQAQVADPVEILSFQGNKPDLWKFTVSPATNQWCAGIEGGWTVIDPTINNELAFCAGATFQTPAAAPALANTGVDTSGYLVAGAAVLLAGAAMVLVARRRTARG
jgi:LPXTG-motif cell wall-anchored protein